jgi:hypothetical protein
MRAAAMFNKLAGFYRITGYEQFAKNGPGILMTQQQMHHILARSS